MCTNIFMKISWKGFFWIDIHPIPRGGIYQFSVQCVNRYDGNSFCVTQRSRVFVIVIKTEPVVISLAFIRFDQLGLSKMSCCKCFTYAWLIIYFYSFVFPQSYQNTKNRLRDFHFNVFRFCNFARQDRQDENLKNNKKVNKLLRNIFVTS